MSQQHLPETEIPVRCFKCGRQLDIIELNPNPFPTPVENRQEWLAFKFKCVNCGTMGQFQYHVEGVQKE